MKLLDIKKLSLYKKRILIRSDLNVPIKNGKILSDIKIQKSFLTILYALNQGGYVMVASHLGNPQKKNFFSDLTLEPIVQYIKKNIFHNTILLKNYLNNRIPYTKNQLIILENVRFNKGETENDEVLSKKYASLCDVFIMDAFGTAHRKHASTFGISKFVSSSAAGLLVMDELHQLDKYFNNPKRPLVIVIGGSKLSTKLNFLHFINNFSDYVIVGGEIANTFIAAKGYNIGKSFYEPNFILEAKHILQNKKFFIPTDVRISYSFPPKKNAIQKHISKIKNHEYILDIGDNSIKKFITLLKIAKTILWNGPIGVFEFINFSIGTKKIAESISESNAISISGGGETIFAIEKFNLKNKISYISTGGGSFLKFFTEKELPTISVLKTH